MAEPIVIDVGKDFSRFPAGRDDGDGDFNGKAFREKFLYPHLRKGMRVIVLLDSAFVYGSSFLDEAFGGLVRTGIQKDSLYSLLDLRTGDEVLLKQILRAIERAKAPAP